MILCNLQKREENKEITGNPIIFSLCNHLSPFSHKSFSVSCLLSMGGFNRSSSLGAYGMIINWFIIITLESTQTCLNV